MEMIRRYILRNRHSVMATTLIVYILAVVVEGAVTGREVRTLDLENPFFDLNIREFDEWRERRDNDEFDS